MLPLLPADGQKEARPLAMVQSNLMNQVQIITKPIAVSDLQQIASRQFGDLVKAVVDIKRGLMAIGGELHADEEAVLLENGSAQADLWGINLYPAKFGQAGWVEFDSMINIRPSQHNRSRGVEAANLRREILAVTNRLVVGGGK